jgi:hypothetical protein
MRWALALSCLFVTAVSLESHLLFSHVWPAEIWELIVGGVFFGCIAWLLYIAAEPIGRRVWPSMFVSSSRLLSRPRVEWRDPLIGQSALVSLVFGAIVFAVQGPLRWSVSAWHEGVPGWLHGYNLDLLLGQRIALAQLAEAVLSANRWFVFVVALVVLRLLVKRAWLAIALTVILWPFMDGVAIGEGLIYSVFVATISMVVLLRWGVVALVATNLISAVAWIARASDWSAWHAKPAVTAFVLVLAFAAYGVWAAIGGRRGSPIDSRS